MSHTRGVDVTAKDSTLDTVMDPDLVEFVQKLEAYKMRREHCFAQLQTTYDIGKGNITSVTQFLERCKDVHAIRESFHSHQDCIIELNSLVTAQYKIPVEAASAAFDEVYYEIKALETSLRPRMERAAPLQPELKLPPMAIPNFDGDLATFSNFWALYNQAVHNGPYSNGVKFSYLRSFLRGAPLDLISNLEINDANYALAYDRIKSQYASHRNLASFYLNKMFEFKPIVNESYAELLSFLSIFDSTYKAYLNVDINNHDNYFLFFFAVRLLPSNLRLLFERSLGNVDSVPTYEQLIKFVDSQCKIKTLTAPSTPASKSSVKSAVLTPSRFSRRSTTLLVTPSRPSMSTQQSSSAPKTCPCCSDAHNLYGCSKYKMLTGEEKIALIKAQNRCFRCLGTHSRLLCKSNGKCMTCSDPRHHSSLHQAFNTSSSPNSSTVASLPVEPAVDLRASSSTMPSRNLAATSPNSCNSGTPATSHTLFTGTNKVDTPEHSVLLATAQALIRDRDGAWSPIRLVIDAGSQINIISVDCARRLGLRVLPRPMQLQGAMNQSLGTAQGIVECVLSNRQTGGPQWCTSAVVLPKVCADLPTVPLPPDVYQRFNGLPLADAAYHIRSKVDFLLGAALYPDIIIPGGQIIHGNPAAIETAFGWVVMGCVPPVAATPVDSPIALCITEKRLFDVVSRFWETEEVDSVVHADPNNAVAEAHYVSTHSRLSCGRYQVRLPFRADSDLPPFGNSRALAERRWFNVEQKLRRNKVLREAYHGFLREFLNMGHMSPATEPGVFVIPHFAILRDSSTSPVRVVFDGSCRDTSGLSINDRLLTGPPLQRDISEIIALFRLHPVAVTCDIKMMFRMIDLHPDDRRFQHILWRESEREPLVEYALNTVVYGLSPSPYLAHRTVQQLVMDEGSAYPRASKVLLESCYTDDVCFSASTESEALQTKQEVVTLLRLGGFELRKWASNSPKVLADVPVEHQASVLTLKDSTQPTLHILGVIWAPGQDHFTYKIAQSETATTKRQILSQVASIYDPLGWMGPVVFWAKSFLQELWTQGLDWDTPLPPALRSRWAAFASQLPSLAQVRIPRHCVLHDATAFMLIGMCDASARGFAAVIYLRCSSPRNVSVSLIKAKSKVAPLKVQTIPRLELNGAALLAKLFKSLSFLVQRLEISTTILFTDSQVVLSWLSTPPHLLKTYVANRVVSILEMTEGCRWLHVPSQQNAADVASRGLTANEILDHTLWWSGPLFLQSPVPEWSVRSSSPVPVESFPEALLEVKTSSVTMVTVSSIPNALYDSISHYSSFSRLRRITAWVLRFVSNVQTTNSIVRLKGPLSSEELRNALHLLVKITQQHFFSDDIQALKGEKTPSKTIRSLSPFIDQSGLVRVGGRLTFSDLSYDAKHPLLLPKEASLSLLLCDYYHKLTLHGGPQATQALLQTQFWILSVRSLLRQRIHKCLTCYRDKMSRAHPKMADLPSARVSPSRPFSHVGVDMAGPLQIKENTSRRPRLVKAYIAVFVCMCTKAVHIELVGNLSTASFRLALDRFVARRGLSRRMYCDQGRNFVGAAHELKEIMEFLRHSENELVDHLAERGIEYCFNPPEAPWMGGLWEAAVKSAKTHLRRIVSNQRLNFEEMSTFLARIEAVLNSRPLCPASSADLAGATAYLSPGHFLVGTPLLSPIEFDLVGVPDNHLANWQAVQKAAQIFWRRWHKEYLHTLIQRNKWTEQRQPLEVGEPVFVYGLNSRPLDWPLAIVERLLPSADGIARAAEVRTKSGKYTRPVAALIPIPRLD